MGVMAMAIAAVLGVSLEMYAVDHSVLDLRDALVHSCRKGRLPEHGAKELGVGLSV